MAATLFCLSFIAGIAVLTGPVAAAGITHVLFVAGIGCVAAVILRLGRRNAWCAACAAALGMALACLAILRPGAIEQPAPAVLPPGSTQTIDGVVVDEPSRTALSTRYIVMLTAVQRSSRWATASGMLLVIDRRTWPVALHGEGIVARGTAAAPQTGASPLPRLDGSLLAIRPQTLRPPLRWLRLARRGVEDRIARALGEPHASLLTGLLTGGQDGMPRATREAFARTGLAHVTAVSGTNVTILLSAIGAALFWLPRRWRLLPSITAIAAYTILVGAGAPVIRAAVMGTLGLLVSHAGRVRHSRLAILWTATIMLAWRPLALREDVGFQLSFLAVIGLAEVAPILARHDGVVPEQFGLRDALRATIAAQLFAAPWAAAVFGTLPVFGLLANLCVVPLIPFTMLLGGIGLAAQSLHDGLGQLLFYPAWLSLDIMLRSANAFASVPGAALEVQLTTAILLAYYAGLVACILLLQRRRALANGIIPPSESRLPLEASA
ncbi:MAG: competence protein ComEC [Candidatus Peregrinibacteria bacterium Gr01-1014_25]|nr:MAG: competence protein ComEC [Candidatus Peregrinibacteria bacterium Gr01-1014_25]